MVQYLTQDPEINLKLRRNILPIENNKFNNLVHVRDANSLVITEVQSRVSPVFHKVFDFGLLLFSPNVLQVADPLAP